MPIDTPEELREHVELAIKVELSTIPPYLYAMYSLEDVQSVPALLIRSIVVEEMLHAALATNLLLAVGGRPDFRSTSGVVIFVGCLIAMSVSEYGGYILGPFMGIGMIVPGLRAERRVRELQSESRIAEA
jgi:hypothetical protein